MEPAEAVEDTQLYDIFLDNSYKEFKLQKYVCVVLNTEKIQDLSLRRMVVTKSIKDEIAAAFRKKLDEVIKD